MSPSATPAMPTAAATTTSTGNQARHQSQPSAISATRHQSQSSAVSATPATQSARPCHQVPRLPRKEEADVAKCHACHAKCRLMSPSAAPATQSKSDKLCVSKLCGDNLCEDKLCVDKLCVCLALFLRVFSFQCSAFFRNSSTGGP